LNILDEFESRVIIAVTKLTDHLLSTMTLSNDSFELRTDKISVAAIDLKHKISTGKRSFYYKLIFSKLLKVQKAFNTLCYFSLSRYS